MAYRRSIVARAKLVYEHQHRISPSFSHFHCNDNDRDNSHSSAVPRNPGIPNYLSSFPGSRNLFQNRRFGIPTGFGSMFSSRNFSSASVGEGAADKIEFLTDVVRDKVVEVAPAASEVAVAAADSFFPVAALQHFMDYVHIYTGLNWWASIIATTLVIRTLQVPLMIKQLKATSKFAIVSPQLEAIKEDMQNRGMSPAAVAQGKTRMNEIFKKHGVTPFTPMKGILITGPIFCSFFFAIQNMAEKVPSFKEGGALWFTDLTTPDSLYIFPVLTALTFWITVECNAQEGLEGNTSAATIKNVSRVFAALTIPFTASFPKAIFCYWITSNLFSLAYGLVMKKPEVKKYFKIPDAPVIPTSSNNKNPAFSIFEAIKKYSEELKKQSPSSQDEEASPEPAIKKIVPSALSQRVKSLEKEVKRKKKGKKR